MAQALASQRPSQNWVLSPGRDLVLIVAAPALGLLWAGGMFIWFGSAVLIGTVMIFNVAHHLPTFIRIYGDRELLRRYRWSLLLGPVVPLAMSLGLVFWLMMRREPITHTSALVMMLTFWAPWHLMMQHYGFMRIYDRHNKAPRRLAVRMDLLLCVTWFVYAFVAAVPWLPNIIERLYRDHGIPLVYLLPAASYGWVEWLAWSAAVSATVLYAGYLIWCWRKGYFVSLTKVLLAAITFAMMYVAFVPNSLQQRWLPEWTFFEGFFAFSMVHNIQYLAIVWKFNRSLAAKEQARSGWFRQGFGATGWLVPFVLLAYVVVCLVYGAVLTDAGKALLQRLLDPATVVGVIFALSFTSEILHYYYDGFIWKVRHKENRDHLSMSENAKGMVPSAGQPSWWGDDQGELTPANSLYRQLLYFGPPMLLLLVTFSLFGQDRQNRAPLSYSDYLNQRPAAEDDMFRWQRALASVERQLSFEKRMNGLRERFRHLSYIAELTYKRSLIQEKLRSLGGVTDGVSKREQLQQAIKYMRQALQAAPPRKHRESQKMTRKQVEDRIEQWVNELTQLNSTS